MQPISLPFPKTISPMQNGLVVATQRNFNDILSNDERKEYNSFNSNQCCGTGLIGNLIYIIIMAGINFLFVIIALSTLIKKNAHYIALATTICPMSSNPLSEYLGDYYNSVFDSLVGDTASFTTFWCKIGSVENGVLISYLIFLIIFIVIEILSLLIHKNVIKIKIEGFFHYLILGLNLLFYALFQIYSPLLFYLFVYCIIVSSVSPLIVNQGEGNRTKSYLEENWDKNKAIPIVNSTFILLIMAFNSAFGGKLLRCIFYYLRKDYEDPNNLNNQNNQNNPNEYTKTKTMYIKNNSIKLQISVNKNIYLEPINDQKKHYKFKQVIIEGRTNGYIYALQENLAICDQLSLADWDYPKLNGIFEKLGKIAYLIYGVLFVSVPLFKLHINNEYNYHTLVSQSIFYTGSYSGKPKFLSVFKSFGAFELGLTNSRFALYVVSIFFILLFMLKRMFFGGFTRPILSLISFVICIIFVLENIIYVILSFLVILFAVFSVVCYYDIDKNASDDMIQTKLYIQMVLNIIIFSICIRILVDSIQLMSMLNKLRKEVSNLSEGTPSENQNNYQGFQFIGIDGKQHVLNELVIDDFPRNVFYSAYEEIGNDPIIINPPNNNTNNNNNNINNNNNLNNNINNNNVNNNNNLNNNYNNNNLNNNINNNNNNSNIILNIKNSNNNNDRININEVNKRNDQRRNSNRNIGDRDELAILRNENTRLTETNRNLENELNQIRNTLNGILRSINVPNN